MNDVSSKIIRPLTKGEKVKIRTKAKADAYHLEPGKTYTITRTVNNRSRRGQYIELEGMGDARFYALYFDVVK